MFYFESLKIKSNPQVNDEKSGLNLSLLAGKNYILTSKDQEWLNQIFYFCKSKKNYLSGSWFVDDVNLVKLENNDFKNFLYNKFSFCDENLIVNKKWTVKKNLKFVCKLLNQKYNDNFLDEVNLNKVVLKTKVAKLSLIEHVKLLILFSILKNNAEYILFNFVNLPQPFFEFRDEIIKIIQNISEKYNITTICFVRYSNEIENILVIDEPKYLYNSKVLTIDDTNFNELKLSPYKNYFIAFWQAVKLYNWKLVELLIATFVLSTIAILFLSMKFVTTNATSPLGNFAKNNHVLAEVMGYIFYFLTYCHLFLWIWWNWKKINCYNSFLDNIGLTFKIRIIIAPIIIFTTIFISLLLAFITNWIIFLNNIEAVNSFWLGLPILLYIIFLVLFIIFIIIYINKSLKETSFKQMILEIFLK